MERCVIVIPIHSPNPSKFELISFKQCFNILGKHPVRIIAPNGLDISEYKNVVPDFDVVYIDPEWLSSLRSYNRLKISRYFYSLFKDYEYLLTYELDAYVFSDQLEYWCDQGYDYIGAPYFEGYSADGSNAAFMGVGNSGFSLRKIRSIEAILKNAVYRPENYARLPFWERMREKIIVPVRFLRNLGKENYTLQRFCSMNEDAFYFKYGNKYYSKFKIAPVDKATAFSFEVSPEKLFVMNNNVLPFGCHAWWKYNLEFWKPYITAQHTLD